MYSWDETKYSLLPTDAGVNSDGQLCSKKNAVFLAPPMKKKDKWRERKLLQDIKPCVII